MKSQSFSLATFDAERLLVRFRHLMRHVWKHFKEDRLFEEAASLSYTSLLAMVPLLAVIFAIISVFPVFSEWATQFQSFVFSNFVPAAGEVIQGYMETFLESIGSLTLPGTVMLFVTALLLMFRIEVAFNKIWRVTEARTFTNRVVMYWAVLTLCPIMIGASAALGAQNLFAALNLDNGVPAGLKGFGIFLLMWTAFTLIFVLVPNRKVRFRDAIAGAFLTTVMFEVAKAAFVAYVTNANYAVIYGALATIPIFLFWLYIVWTVVLFGASLAASLTTFKYQPRTDAEWPEGLELQLAYRLVGHLWEAQRRGKVMATAQLLEFEQDASEKQVRELLSRLRDKNIVAYDPDEGWSLIRDLEELTLGDLQKSGHFYLPLIDIENSPRGGRFDAAFLRALSDIRDNGKGVLQTPLRQLYRASASRTGA
ncbi:MAG TPA: YihY family inner membrane protein [Xanthomonadales bacterium]|nr:YihY family inner membrane protein [Xanthomonadales bacterium]